MFAVIETGGKQYKVAKNDIIKIERLSGKEGDKVTLDRVLLLNDSKSVKIGDPLVSGVSVSAEILEQTRGDKVIVFKKKRRKKYRKTQGHRQDLTVLKILAIGDGKAAAKKSGSAAAATKPKKDAKEAPKKAAAKSTAKKTATKTKSGAKTATAKKAAGTKKSTGAAKAKKPANASAKAPAKK